MSNTLHAFDFLQQKDPISSRVIVAFGDEPFLKAEVNKKIRQSLLAGEDDDINLVKLTGQATYSEVADELDTISLFGGGLPRVVVVSEADGFISDNRDLIEKLVDKPSTQGFLILDVSSWRSNTRLYKAIDKKGLQIDCRPPQLRKSVDTGKMAKWASKWAKSQHQIKIKPAVVEHMMDLTGIELGIVDQNLAKLALYFDAKTEITDEAIDELIGGWQTKSIYQIIENVIYGHTGPALSQLNRLFDNGEAPQALFGQIAWSLRRFAMAFDEAQRYRRHGKRLNVDDVIANAGFRPYEKSKAVEQLGKIGREKGYDFYRLLLECDLAMKSSHASPRRARLALEKLVFDLVASPTAT